MTFLAIVLILIGLAVYFLVSPQFGGLLIAIGVILLLIFLIFVSADEADTRTAAPVQVATPDFGPGSSVKGPNDAGAKCHPPGQTVLEPGCK